MLANTAHITDFRCLQIRCGWDFVLLRVSNRHLTILHWHVPPINFVAWAHFKIWVTRWANSNLPSSNFDRPNELKHPEFSTYPHPTATSPTRNLRNAEEETPCHASDRRRCRSVLAPRQVLLCRPSATFQQIYTQVLCVVQWWRRGVSQLWGRRVAIFKQEEKEKSKIAQAFATKRGRTTASKPDEKEIQLEEAHQVVLKVVRKSIRRLGENEGTITPWLAIRTAEDILCSALTNPSVALGTGPVYELDHESSLVMVELKETISRASKNVTPSSVGKRENKDETPVVRTSLSLIFAAGALLKHGNTTNK